jgi:hypothetical protein
MKLAAFCINLPLSRLIHHPFIYERKQSGDRSFLLDKFWGIMSLSPDICVLLPVPFFLALISG